MSVKISASILSGDFGNMGKEIESVTSAGADFIHLDVMDGNFVPNITIGADFIKSVRKYSNLPFEAHLMVSEPERHIKAFAEAGSDYIIIHHEAVIHLDRAVNQIHAEGKKAGISINPTTHESCLEYLIDKIDLILVMTVNPGFGGQKFITSQFSKIRNIHKMIEKSVNKNIILSVDGGVTSEIAPKVVEAGANLLVSGNAIFLSKDYKYAIESLKMSHK
jgi:ribulose-phosphate 3-epimerase